MLKAKKKWVAVSLIIAILFVMINYPTHDKSSKAETQNAIEFFVTPAPSTIPVPSATVAPLATPYYDYGVSNVCILEITGKMTRMEMEPQTNRMTKNRLNGGCSL